MRQQMKKQMQQKNEVVKEQIQRKHEAISNEWKNKCDNECNNKERPYYDSLLWCNDSQEITSIIL